MDDRSAGPGGLDVAGRPTARLPMAQLLQVSIYWFGISAVWGGWGFFSQERVPELVGAGETGLGMALLALVAMVVPLFLQPTIGSISDYTTSRWGRRKPYIAIGATLDVVFLIGIATSQSFLALLAFLLLLQFSSNFAQGPFQGYVPDLVPEAQVGIASGLMGLMSVLGLIGGTIILSLGYGFGRNWTVPLIAVGFIELATALGTVFWVREGRAAKPREGRSWRQVALETWGTDVLRERSYVWLLVSRFFILMAAAMFINFNIRYLTDSLGLDDDRKAFWVPALTGIVALATVLGTVPSARLSDRLGRKPLIYAGCAIGAVGMAILVAAPSVELAAVGAALVGFGGGNFLAVDWALMTDIIPKASSGRYMGLSNVATATNGPAAIALGGVIYWGVGNVVDPGTGIRFALLVAVGIYGLGAFCLRPVIEPRRAATVELVPAPG
ncbi:MAG TPA: MFS transporter [Candidatus Limnocylindrales bacterium]